MFRLFCSYFKNYTKPRQDSNGRSRRHHNAKNLLHWSVIEAWCANIPKINTNSLLHSSYAEFREQNFIQNEQFKLPATFLKLFPSRQRPLLEKITEQPIKKNNHYGQYTFNENYAIWMKDLLSQVQNLYYIVCFFKRRTVLIQFYIYQHRNILNYVI